VAVGWTGNFRASPPRRGSAGGPRNVAALSLPGAAMRDLPMSVDPTPVNPPAAGLEPTGHDALPAGTRFGEFEILRVLGAGGFGIVYLAQDHSLERQVALKEYMPAMLAARGAGAAITVRARSFAETYANGLRSFVNEARLLARFDHPSLVKVYRVWEDNGTAYMVMPCLQGRTLRDARLAMAAAPAEAWLRGVLAPMLDALEVLHGEGVFHRDIAPDNILLANDGTPTLLDFGAARRVIGEGTQSLTAILKPSYAPIEQYAEMTTLRQGPWTDLYALGAVLHFLLFGVPPAPATVRALQPDAEPIDQRRVAGVSPHFMSAVGWMLGVRPAARPQNVAALRAALNGELPIPTPRPDAPPLAGGATWMALTAAGGTAPVPVDNARRTTVPAVALAREPSGPTIPPPAPASRPASVPMRSTPPGTLPPVSMPAPRTVPMHVEPKPEARAASALPPPARRAPMLAGLAAAAALAALVLWQFVAVIHRERPAGSAPIASNAAEPVAAGASAAPQDRPAVVRAAAPRPSSRREPVVAAGPPSARAACGDRHFIAYAICVDRECEQPRFRDSADCMRLLDDKRRRAER
jgi:serine/threonine protein kinase